MRLRRIRLRGRDADVAAGLDRLHVQADVRGVEERAGECEVWIEGAVPSLADVAGLRVDELPVTAAMFAHTGREHDAPVLVAPDLCVRPPWVGAPAGFDGIDLVVPRGSAFGSGEHASTRAALLALHGTWPARAVACCVDVGTGSGILALYARARGAQRIVACDIDPTAARAAAQLLPGAFVFVGPPAASACRADVVVANMTAAELADACAAIVSLWTQCGVLVLCGLRGAAERDACRQACAQAGVAIEPAVWSVEDFAALTFTAPVRSPA